MTTTEPRILSITTRHPSPQQRETQVTNPSHVRVTIDTGLKSGKLTFIYLDIGEAIDLQAQLAKSIHNAYHAREGMPA